MDRISLIKHFVKSNEKQLLHIFSNESNQGKNQGALYINITNMEDIKVYFINSNQMDTASPHYKTVVLNKNEKKCFIIGIDNNNEFILIEAVLDTEPLEQFNQTDKDIDHTSKLDDIAESDIKHGNILESDLND